MFSCRIMASNILSGSCNQVAYVCMCFAKYKCYTGETMKQIVIQTEETLQCFCGSDGGLRSSPERVVWIRALVGDIVSRP